MCYLAFFTFTKHAQKVLLNCLTCVTASPQIRGLCSTLVNVLSVVFYEDVKSKSKEDVFSGFDMQHHCLCV